MKSRGIIIAVIALLSVWAVLATITAVDNENRRSRLYDERAELQEECERQKRAYEKLEAEYDELETECEELKSARLKGLAYEWLYDMRCHFTEDGYDGAATLTAIFEREGLTSAERAAVHIYIDGILKYE